MEQIDQPHARADDRIVFRRILHRVGHEHYIVDHVHAVRRVTRRQVRICKFSAAQRSRLKVVIEDVNLPAVEVRRQKKIPCVLVANASPLYTAPPGELSTLVIAFAVPFQLATMPSSVSNRNVAPPKSVD